MGSEQVGSLLQGAVTGEHNATLLVPFFDDIVEVLRGRRVQRLEPEVVQHRQVRAEVGLEVPLQGAISAAAVDVLEEVDPPEYLDYHDACRQIGRFLDDVYLHKRIHSSLGYPTPAEFDVQWCEGRVLALEFELIIV
ncbi:MAG: hypothetical protein SVR04_15310 [Spirochaetota bacterium]|nr:hypothetical protein [Spirochaetota bacterium]